MDLKMGGPCLELVYCLVTYVFFMASVIRILPQRDLSTTHTLFQILGYKNNCTIAEFLAIDDEGFQHKRLVRFFKRAGFHVVRYVGEDLASVPDRLVWGGCGTLMKREIRPLLIEWSTVLKIDQNK